MSYYDDCHVAMCQLHSGTRNRQAGILLLARAIPLHTVNNKRKLSIWQRIKRQIYGLSFLSLYCCCCFLETNFWFAWYTFSLITINNKKIKEECPMMRGNADIYGIGIRIAIYLQMVYTVLVQCLSPKNMGLVGPINIWFLFTLMVVMCATLGASGSPAELFLLHALGSGLKGLVLGPVFRQLPELALENQFTSFARVIVSGLWLGYSSNLWWSVLYMIQTNAIHRLGIGFFTTEF